MLPMPLLVVVSVAEFIGYDLLVPVSAFLKVFTIKHLLFWSFAVLAGGLEHFTELLLRFPNNIHILLEMAKVRNGFTLMNISF